MTFGGFPGGVFRAVTVVFVMSGLASIVGRPAARGSFRVQGHDGNEANYCGWQTKGEGPRYFKGDKNPLRPRPYSARQPAQFGK